MSGEFLPILTIDATKTGTTLASAIHDRDAFGQFLIGEEYLTAAQVMVDATEDEVRLIRPKFMLLCQGVELCLKSFLLSKGVPASDLNRKPLNHDLERLLARCLEVVSNDEVFIGPEHQATIRGLAPAAAMFYFRYGHREPASLYDVATVHVPLMRDAMDATCALFDVVRVRALTF